jgi:hypothetical protein
VRPWCTVLQGLSQRIHIERRYEADGGGQRVVEAGSH